MRSAIGSGRLGTVRVAAQAQLKTGGCGNVAKRPAGLILARSPILIGQALPARAARGAQARNDPAAVAKAAASAAAGVGREPIGKLAALRPPPAAMAEARLEPAKLAFAAGPERTARARAGQDGLPGPQVCEFMNFPPSALPRARRAIEGSTSPSGQ